MSTSRRNISCSMPSFILISFLSWVGSPGKTEGRQRNIHCREGRKVGFLASGIIVQSHEKVDDIIHYTKHRKWKKRINWRDGKVWFNTVSNLGARFFFFFFEKASDNFTSCEEQLKGGNTSGKSCHSQQGPSRGLAFLYLLPQWQFQNSAPPPVRWKQLLVWAKPLLGGNKWASGTAWLMTAPMQICKQPHICYLSLAKR